VQLGESEKDVVRAFCQLDMDSRGSIDSTKIKGARFNHCAAGSRLHAPRYHALHHRRRLFLQTTLPLQHALRGIGASAGSLGKLGLPATDANAAAMMRALGKAEDATIAYGEFRRFAVLMPRDKLTRDTEASLAWFESATCVPLSGAFQAPVAARHRCACSASLCILPKAATPQPPSCRYQLPARFGTVPASRRMAQRQLSYMGASLRKSDIIVAEHAHKYGAAAGKSDEVDGTFKVLLKAALAGGFSSGASTLLLHPLDTLKTRVQSIPGASIASVVKDVPTLGRRAMYRGIVPSTSGAFSSHGIRTCAYEAGLMALASLGVPYMKAQPLAAFAGTFVGTLVRIPCEVLKQQLQRGNHPNVVVRELRPSMLCYIVQLRGVSLYCSSVGCTGAWRVATPSDGSTLRRVFGPEV
jgi:hypothetical protein